MKITISDNAKRDGFGDDEAKALVDALSWLGDRFTPDKMTIDTDHFGGEATVKVWGDALNHGRQGAEMHISMGMLADTPDKGGIKMVAQSLCECIDRDLKWMDTGRCLSTPSTDQLTAAREFLGKHLSEIETAWMEEHEQPMTVAGTPVPLHVHLWNVIQGLRPTEVEDAHRERAEELLKPWPVLPADFDPVDVVAQAIADAESRGEQKGREA